MLKDEKYSLSNGIKEFLIDKEEQKRISRDSNKEFKLQNGIEVQAEVIKRGADYWRKAIEFGKTKKLLSDVESSFLLSATKIDLGRIPSEKQCQRILNIEAKLIEEGFSG